MLKYEMFYGDISANRKVYVHTNKGTTNDSCELLEAWLEKTGYTLVSMIQPDPVRVPHKVNIVVSKFDYTKLDYASVETRVANLFIDPARDSAGTTVFAMLKKCRHVAHRPRTPRRGPRAPQREPRIH